MKKIIFSLFIIISFYKFTLKANTGESGLALLMLDSYGARNIAMNDTFTGIANDINTISVNPAGLGTLHSMEVSSMYMRYFGDMTFGYLAFGMPLPSNAGYAGASVALFSLPDFDQNDGVGNKLNTPLSASDFGVSIAYANNPLKLLNIDKNLNLGINLKYVQSKLVDTTSSIFGFDIGALYKINLPQLGKKDVEDNFGIGIAYQNLGSSLKYGSEETVLPQNLRFGVGYNGYTDNNHSVLIGLDVNLPNDSKEIISVGLEYSFIKMIFARLGYKITGTEIDGLSCGIGGAYTLAGKKFSLDYALIPLTDFDTVHTFSLGVKF